MIAIDTSALVAVLRREDEADRFLQAMVTARTCCLSAVSLVEVSLVLAGRQGDRLSWRGLDALLARLAVEVVAHDAVLAVAAREAFLHYGKGRHRAALNFGDCASYALAKTRGLPLLFKGADFEATDLQAVR